MKKRGRPPKNGVVEPEHFGRALKLTYAYSEARKKGLKHSAAVREAVEFVRRLNPATPVSESAVRRVLAEFRPQNSEVEITVEYSTLEGSGAAACRSRFAQLLKSSGNENVPALSDEDLRRPLKAFKFGFGKRLDYPRHNAKPSKA
jgi:hypothetical protein